MRSRRFLRHTVWMALLLMGIFIAVQVDARGGRGGGGGGRGGGGFSGGGGRGGGGGYSRSGAASSGSFGANRSSRAGSYSRGGAASSGSFGANRSSSAGSYSRGGAASSWQLAGRRFAKAAEPARVCQSDAADRPKGSGMPRVRPVARIQPGTASPGSEPATPLTAKTGRITAREQQKPAADCQRPARRPAGLWK